MSKYLTGKLWGCGAVGARFLGMEEVAGSNPASSTSFAVRRFVEAPEGSGQKAAAASGCFEAPEGSGCPTEHT